MQTNIQGKNSVKIQYLANLFEYLNSPQNNFFKLTAQKPWLQLISRKNT